MTFHESDQTLCINKKPLVIAGINRTEFDALEGRRMSEEVMKRDIELIKSFNFNAVRTAHYPTCSRWLELCDEAGLYVVDEANIETHGFQSVGQPVSYLSSLKSWRGAFWGRVGAMVERDKNHPSVIIWSLGNESGCGSTHNTIASWLRKRDPFRKIQVWNSFSSTINLIELISMNLEARVLKLRISFVRCTSVLLGVNGSLDRTPRGAP